MERALSPHPLRNGPPIIERCAQFVTRHTIQKCGTPDEIVTDNGREFTSAWEDRPKFGEMLAELGIRHLTCTPYYPQGNGKAEVFIRTLNRELLRWHKFETVEELQAAPDRFLIYHNNYRLHSGLGWQPSVTCFTG